GEDLGVGAAAEGEEAGGAGDHHRHDPPDQMVQVDAAVADHAARPPRHFRAPHQPGAGADEGEGEQEAAEHEEEALLFVLDEVVPEVGEDRRGDHPVPPGAECSCGPDPSLRWISSTVSSTAATAKRGERTMLEETSASQLARKVSPSQSWTRWTSASPI